MGPRHPSHIHLADCSPRCTHYLSAGEHLREARSSGVRANEELAAFDEHLHVMLLIIEATGRPCTRRAAHAPRSMRHRARRRRRRPFPRCRRADAQHRPAPCTSTPRRLHTSRIRCRAARAFAFEWLATLAHAHLGVTDAHRGAPHTRVPPQHSPHLVAATWHISFQPLLPLLATPGACLANARRARAEARSPPGPYPELMLTWSTGDSRRWLTQQMHNRASSPPSQDLSMTTTRTQAAR